MPPAPPLAMLAELTHRCPMRCVYCSNPLALEPASHELPTAVWRRVFSEAAEIGVLQLHFSGGEPTVRDDLCELIAGAAAAGLYTNLITSGVLLDRAQIARLAEAGLDHFQLSVQDVDIGAGERIGGLPGAQAKKLAVAGFATEAGLALTINAVIHRHNAARVGDLIELALVLGAGRIEVAHVQYYGWALRNRSALLPSRAQLEATRRMVEEARRALAGRLVIDYVPADYHARFPKACMGGWGRTALVVDPAGRMLPCHAARTIPELTFPSVLDCSLAEAWENAAAFNKFRGSAWMPEPCASCPRREEDWGGCRCQALALTGDAGATDPVCEKSAAHAIVTRLTTPGAVRPSSLVFRGTAADQKPAPRRPA